MYLCVSLYKSVKNFNALHFKYIFFKLKKYTETIIEMNQYVSRNIQYLVLLFLSSNTGHSQINHIYWLLLKYDIAYTYA